MSITARDLTDIAFLLVDRHGPDAAFYATRAVQEMEDQGDEPRADAWRALRSFIEDAIEGRIERSAGDSLH